MKNLILFLLFTSAIGQAQIVSIPDINFKMKLLSANTTNNLIAKDLNENWTVIDTNGDNLIQQSEANNISYLYFYNNSILNFTGLNSFSNLKKCEFSYSNEGITNVNIDFSNLTLLEEISFNHLLNLENINFTNCTSLKKVHVLFGLSSINLTNCNSLEYISLSETNITAIDLSNKSNIKDVIIEQGYVTNGIQSIDLSNCINLEYLSLPNNSISDLDLSNLSNLKYLDIRHQKFNYTVENSGNTTLNLILEGCNNLDEIIASENILANNYNFSNLPNLQKLSLNNCSVINSMTPQLNISNSLIIKNIEINNSNLSGIYDLSNYDALDSVSLNDNHISQLNLEGLTNLKHLYIKSNNLNTLNNDNCPSLQTLQCQNNQLTSLDLSSCGNLESVNCDNNNLQYISFKNNTNETKSFLNNPNLTYICADETEQWDVQLIVNLYEMWDTCLVGDYCSFTPNGNYNTISGNTLYDNENNGCDSNDTSFEFLRVNLSDGTTSGSTFTNAEGNYKFYTNAGTFTLTPQLENPTYFNASPTTANFSFTDNLNNVITQNFCITPNGFHNDVEVVIAPIIPARPGFDAVYKLVFKNKGNQTLSGTVNFTFDDTKLDFLTASIMPKTTVTGSLSWDYINLQPFENRSIIVTLNVNSPAETPAVNNGDVLAFQSVINPVLGDEIPTDNTFMFNQTVVGSYDPNNILCIEGAVVPPSEIGNFLHYLVRFENTGTASAENVVVKTEIDPNEFDIATLQLLNASHPVYTRIKNNKVEFIFENIQLQSSEGGNGGHGHVLMKIKSKPTLQANDVVSKLANIYFDYNFPITTNNYETVFQILNSQSFDPDTTVSIYPNPTKNNINIQAKNPIKTIELFDNQGRVIQSISINKNQTLLDISNRANGIYFVRIMTEEGKKVEKIIKE